MSCNDDGEHRVASPSTSIKTSTEQPHGTTTMPLSTGLSSVPGGEKLVKKQPNASASLPAKKVNVSAAVLTHGSSKLLPKKAVLMKQSLIKTAGIQTPMETERSAEKSAVVPSKKKTVRPAAWLLHSIGLRMVREKVYDDLIEIQEQKDEDGLLSANEQRQLGRLRGAYGDLIKQNRPFTVRTKRHCRCCGFAAGLRLELELHRDYGSVSGDDYRYSCCLCNLRYIRSPGIMAAHIERTHGRRARMHTIPPTGFCPYCPYEQRTVTKVKLSRHVINCSLTFRIDRNLAPTAADADIPLYEIMKPPASTVQTTTTGASVAGIKSSSVLTDKTSVSSSSPALSSGCTTVSVAGPVMTPAESQSVTTALKIPLAKLARLVSLPEGLGFEICELCGAFLAGQESVMLHMIRAHKMVLPAQCLRAEKPVVSCDKCTERFWTPVGLSVHMTEMHDGKTEPASPPTTICPLCKRTRLTDVLEHLARQHRITLVDMFAQRYCSVCQLTLHSARSFEHHMLTRHSDLFPDRAGLYAAVVMVDRATRGRVGMVGRGRQPAILSGATSKPSSTLGQVGSSCPVCLCEYSSDEEVEAHVRRVHGFVCPHCGQKCTSNDFLSHHVVTVHPTASTPCQLCGSEVTVSAITEHLQSCHTQSCAVSLQRVQDYVVGQVERLERKRRRGSESSDSVDDSNDESSELPDDERHSAAKKLKMV